MSLGCGSVTFWWDSALSGLSHVWKLCNLGFAKFLLCHGVSQHVRRDCEDLLVATVPQADLVTCGNFATWGFAKCTIVSRSVSACQKGLWGPSGGDSASSRLSHVRKLCNLWICQVTIMSRSVSACQKGLWGPSGGDSASNGLSHVWKLCNLWICQVHYSVTECLSIS
jgi:hypothetical protein